MASIKGESRDAEESPAEPLLIADKPQATRTSGLSLVAAVAYGTVSLSMGFINKGVLLTYPYANTLLTLQMGTTIACIALGAASSVIQVRPFSGKVAWRLLPLAAFYNGNVAFSLASLQGLNIPMYIALKRLTPMAVLIAGLCNPNKRKPSLQVVLSVSATVIGCIIAAWGDLDFDFWGYTLAIISVFLQTGYLIMVERGGEEGLNSSEMMNYNALLSLPFLVLFILLTGEAGKAFPELLHKVGESAGFLVVVVLSLLMAMVLNFTMFLCTITNSALTTTIVGVLKGVGSTTLGFFLLGGVEFNFVNVLGLVINTCGGVWYSYVKYHERASRSRPSLSGKDAGVLKGPR